MSSKNKKVINKEDLRRLMKQQKKNDKKIESPLAKYDSVGQLHCSLCGCKVKTDLLWTAHINGRTHKHNLISLKEEQLKKHEATVRPPEPSNNSKRKFQDREDTSKKIRKIQTDSNKSSNNLPSDFFDTSSAQVPSQKGLQLGDYGSDEESEEEQPTPSAGSGDTAPMASGLPSDFFDSGVKPSSSTIESNDGDQSEEPSVKSMAEQLPEGFFDDAKQDAKVRQIEYKDKMEEEWEMFQKAMKEEHQVSEALQEEDEEAVQVERNIDQIDEQIYHWSKVEELHQRKEEVMSHTEKTGEEDNSSNSDNDEQEYEEFMDWRSKKVS